MWNMLPIIMQRRITWSGIQTAAYEEIAGLRDYSVALNLRSNDLLLFR